jgi:DNA replication and repair protein RecF
MQPSIYISNIILSNFRSHEKFTINSNSKNIVLFGKNGVGKTNILESISLLSPGRGLRNAKNEEIINKNTNTDYGLSANLQFDNNSIKIKKTYLRN